MTTRTPEAILNLWFVSDAHGYICSLRAKAYVAQGTDLQMMQYLVRAASGDYLNARRFSLPKSFETVFVREDGQTTLPVIHLSVLRAFGGILSLFCEIYAELAAQPPLSDQGLALGKENIVCITQLVDDGSGKLTPITADPQFNF